jgi:16S rRNA (guanine966-N2)-methyltransferase
MGKIRIIGGEWRGRTLTVLDKPHLRPTPNRIRETLFNWLNWSIPSSHCLDLFAGTGALGLEAASRGAKSVYLVEHDAQLATQLRALLTQLNATQVKVIQQNAFHFLNTPPEKPFNIVFLDPPFGHDYLLTCCQALSQAGWLSSGALIYLEAEQNLSELPLPAQWQWVKKQQAGQVNYFLARNNL